MEYHTCQNQTLTKQQRYVEGQRLAQAAAALLRKDYRVSKVALFGSRLQPQWIRSDSDVDLAVWGLADADYDRAFQAVAALSTEVAVDLVQVESAQPSLQRKIETQGHILGLQPWPDASPAIAHPTLQPPAMNDRAVLWGQIQQELADLERLVQHSQALLAKLRTTQDEDYLGTLALDLHGFYGRVERIFKQIAQTVDGSVPDQADWHRQLLRQMAAPVVGVRPAIASADLLSLLDDYCAFRHVVRNIYSTRLKSDRVERLTHDLPHCFERLQTELQAFIATVLEPP